MVCLEEIKEMFIAFVARENNKSLTGKIIRLHKPINNFLDKVNLQATFLRFFIDRQNELSIF